MKFHHELKKYGPGASFVSFTEENAIRYCRRLARSHYENFTVVSRFLPKRLRDDFFIVYAYCRFSDDIGDEIDASAESLRLFDWWESETIAAYEQTNPVHPISVALSGLFRRSKNLPLDLFLDLLSAFRQDQTKKSYATMTELLDYCRRSANPVGRILLYLIMGSPSAADLTASDAVCSGLQLTNFWQDVRRDEMIGRNYVPTEVAAQFPDFRERMKWLIDDAESRLLAGRSLLRSVPRDIKFDIALFIEGGLAILRKIRQIDYKVDKIRPRLSKFEKGLLAIQTWVRLRWF